MTTSDAKPRNERKEGEERERRRGGQETHVELIFIHVLILVGSNGDDRSYCNEKQIKYHADLEGFFPRSYLEKLYREKNYTLIDGQIKLFFNVIIH